jgi:hypothetical protein
MTSKRQSRLQPSPASQESPRAPPSPPRLVDHLEWIAEPGPGFALDLAEDEPTAAPDDQIELVPAAPDIRAKDAVAAQAVVAGGACLVRVARRTQAR